MPITLTEHLVEELNNMWFCTARVPINEEMREMDRNAADSWKLGLKSNAYDFLLECSTREKLAKTGPRGKETCREASCVSTRKDAAASWRAPAAAPASAGSGTGVSLCGAG